MKNIAFEEKQNRLQHFKIELDFNTNGVISLKLHILMPYDKIE